MSQVTTPTILDIARAHVRTESNPEVANALQKVIAKDGDLSLALAGITGNPGQYGVGRDFLKRLVDETFAALLGKEELIDQLEVHRKSVIGKAVTSIGVGVGIISGATGLQVAIATIVFLYLVPIGVRAAYETWKAERPGGADKGPKATG